MLILASKSPRRQELLKIITKDFQIKSATVDETLPAGITPYDAVLHLSKIKAMPFFSGTECVIGADTVVAVDNNILGKPADKNEAVGMLTMLSGREHSVYTGVTLLTPKNCKSFYCETKIKFYDISSMIQDYVETDEPYDKAGAYGIQGKAALFVKEIHGDFYNVVGLPVAMLYRELTEAGVLY